MKINAYANFDIQEVKIFEKTWALFGLADLKDIDAEKASKAINTLRNEHDMATLRVLQTAREVAIRINEALNKDIQKWASTDMLSIMKNLEGGLVAEGASEIIIRQMIELRYSQIPMVEETIALINDGIYKINKIEHFDEMYFENGEE